MARFCTLMRRKASTNAVGRFPLLRPLLALGVCLAGLCAPTFFVPRAGFVGQIAAAPQSTAAPQSAEGPQSARVPERHLPGENQAIRRALVHAALHRLQVLGMNTAQVTLPEADRKLLSRTPSRYGMFLSVFRRRDLRLLGCMGSTQATASNLLDEIEHWSHLALGQDPRFRGRLAEARARGQRVTVIVSFVEKVEAIENPLTVDALRFGLLLRFRGRAELVLPGEARTAAVALRLVRQKLGLNHSSTGQTGAMSDGMEAFRVHAVRFGPGRKLFEKRGGFAGTGG